MQKSTEDIYDEKVFVNARRGLLEAQGARHPYANNTTYLVDPKSGEKTLTLEIIYAINWCIKKHVQNWSASTWRMQRSAYSKKLDDMVKEGSISSEKAQKIKDIMSSVRAKTKREVSLKKTSSKRKKSITDVEFLALQSEVRKRDYDWGEPLILWLRAGMATGLRPNEWQGAKITDEFDVTVLTVKNFKHNEVRSYAENRSINISDLTEEEIKAARAQIEVVKRMVEQNAYQEYYRGCRNLLYYLNRRVFPNRRKLITLYTGRHQFSANAKADDSVSDLERAAMMGHRKTRTSEMSYGKKRLGSSGRSPEIADKNVLKNIVQHERPKIGNKNKLT